MKRGTLACEDRATSGRCCSSPGHGNFPYLCGNLNDVVVSPLLHTCYQSSQSLARAHEQYGASAVQPISEETQLLLTVYYLVQLGEPPHPRAARTPPRGAGSAEPSWLTGTVEAGRSGWWKGETGNAPTGATDRGPQRSPLRRTGEGVQ